MDKTTDEVLASQIELKQTQLGLLQERARAINAEGQLTQLVGRQVESELNLLQVEQKKRDEAVKEAAKTASTEAVQKPTVEEA